MALILSGTDGLSDVDGSAATPAIRGTDTNTGIFFPAADTIAFSEGGVESMRLDSSGNLGIGTNAPGFPLTVASSTVLAAGSPSIVVQGANNNERLHIRSFGVGGVGTGQPVILLAASAGTVASPAVTSSGSNLGYYQLGGYDGTSFSRGAWLTGLADGEWSGSNRGSHMVFSTTPSGSTTITERMRITSAGDVGIGTSSPSTSLYVNRASSGHAATFYSNGGGVTTGFNQYGITLTGNVSNGGSECNIVYGVGTGSGLAFNSWDGTSQTERMRITGAGNVLIGTTSGGSARLIVDSGSVTLIASFNSTNASGGYATWQTSGTTIADIGTAQNCFGSGGSDTFAINGRGARALLFGTNNTERMRIDSSGNLFIGTTGNGGSSANKVNILAGISTARRGIQVINEDGNAGPAYIAFRGYDWTRSAVWSDRANNHSLAFATNPNTADLSVGGCVARVALNDAGNMFPVADNTYSIGISGNRWSAVWAANGTIQTSDLNAKTDIVESPLGLDFVKSLRPVAYKFKVGKNSVVQDPNDKEKTIITPIAGKRQHFGLIAQEVKQVLPTNVDFGGWVQTDINDPNSEQGLRYEEFIAPLIKAIQEQQALINDLTTRLTALENK